MLLKNIRDKHEDNRRYIITTFVLTIIFSSPFYILDQENRAIHVSIFVCSSSLLFRFFWEKNIDKLFLIAYFILIIIHIYIITFPFFDFSGKMGPYFAIPTLVDFVCMAIFVKVIYLINNKIKYNENDNK